jgi:hypothetical protein
MNEQGEVRLNHIFTWHIATPTYIICQANRKDVEANIARYPRIFKCYFGNSLSRVAIRVLPNLSSRSH